MERPNILLLVVDSLRADVIYDPRVPTPVIDHVASQGASFKQCVATATTTTPSFSSILTGCYPPKHGMRGLQGYRLSENVKTMAEAFGGSGYNTYAEVTGPLLPETGILRGFDKANHRPGYRQPWFGWRDDVIEKIKGFEPPWLLLLHLWEVHRPFRPPPDFVKKFDRAGYEQVVAGTDEYIAPVLEAAGDDTILVFSGDHGEQYPDSSFERLVFRAASKTRRKLKPRKWWPWLDRKLAGQAVGHGFALYEHLVRVPLVVAGPGISRGVIEQQVRHIDLFPTLADLTGVPIPAGIDGRTLRPLMEGSALPEEPAYMEAVGVKLEGNRIQGVRTPDWKLLKAGGGRPTLHRLSGNGSSNEKRDLYRRHPEIAHELQEFMERIATSSVAEASPMTADEEALVEKHLHDLGYL